MLKRIVVLLFGVVSYAMFFGTFLYAVGFVGNLVVPKSMDSPATMPFLPALGIDLLLLSVFAVQHSVMARPWFKRAWTRIIPEAAERSFFVLASSLALIALFRFWQPLGGVIWDVKNAVAHTLISLLFGFGFGLVLVSTFLINHFDLFGLRQVWLNVQGKPYTRLKFRTPLFYRYVRHPLYLGFMIGFWATPRMTGVHLLFAAMTTAYMVLAIQFEEHDLVDSLGDDYEQYRENVPMLLPSMSGYQAPQPKRTLVRTA